MTLVASWLNLESNAQRSIWLVADSKISKDEHAAHTLEGAKVLELPVCCRSFSGSDWGEVLTRKSLGFAFAGSTLVALNTYAALTTILSNLSLGGPKRQPPDAVSILQTVAKVLKYYIQSISSGASLFIVGFCPRTNKPFIGTLKPNYEGDDGAEVSIHINNYEQAMIYLDIHLIGSHDVEIKERMKNRAESLTVAAGIDYWRTPLYVLHDIIRDQEFSEIGGGLQLGVIGEHYGFRHQAFTADTTDNTDFIYRNINLDKVVGHFVGDCFFSLPGLILPK